ncbi:MAG TPA: CarD family transcriptional regulator [Anaerolineales bacterium]|nr:CarD family transcriptional regulator [Anaerolineales bacterium]HNN13990.1 CarD family transcriptional regulator [Anaerolineales bacterium]
MTFKPGEWVVHCTHGLGQIVDIEERVFDTRKALFYSIRINDLTLWVADDENIKTRLRYPVNEDTFHVLFQMLASPPEALPSDRRERNQYLLEALRDGSAESLCRVIRDLSAYRKEKSWSDYDNELIRRTQRTLVGEWSHVFSIAPGEAEVELHKLLAHYGRKEKGA